MDLYTPPRPALIAPAPSRLHMPRRDRGMFGAAGGMFGGGLPVSVALIGSTAFEANSDGDIYETTFSLDTADPSRLLVAVFHGSTLGVNSDPPTCQFFCNVGVTLVARNASSGTTAYTTMYRASVPTNANNTIRFARAGTMGYGILLVYSIKNLISHTPTDTDGRSTSGSIDLDAIGGGVALVALYHGTNDTTPTVITTNKQRKVANGTGSGSSVNCFHLVPTLTQTYSPNSNSGFQIIGGTWK